MSALHLSLLEGVFAICHHSPEEGIPSLPSAKGFLSLTITPEEISLVCREDQIPSSTQVERGWKVLKVEGPLDFSLTGILASIASPLAEGEVSIFAISTFDTDYILIKEMQMEKAWGILSEAGFVLNPPYK